MIPFPKKRYQIIYADPPWKYVHWNDDKVTRKAPYPLMTTDEIFDLPVQDIADDTCILFLTQWFTNNLPGSDNSGVPASDIKDKILPSLKYSITFESCFFSLNL